MTATPIYDAMAFEWWCLTRPRMWLMGAGEITDDTPEQYR